MSLQQSESFSQTPRSGSRPISLDIVTDYPSHPLLKLPLFTQRTTHLTNDQQLKLSYDRARAIAKVYKFTYEDAIKSTPKFWQMHRDPVASIDGASYTLLSAQYNLAAATIAPFAAKREDLRPLLKKILDFDVNAQFILSEVGHGLDAPNLETTATLQADGSFDLHTPNKGAAKWMPPTCPVKGHPRLAVLIAQLIVDGESHGVRPFVVWLNDGIKMFDGITSKTIPNRAGSRPLDHNLTIFNHVRLPSTALLGSLEKPKNPRLNFLSVIWRIGVGGLCLSMANLASLKTAVYVAGTYSLRRLIRSPEGKKVPIISFRTQQRPIFHTLAQIAVLEPYATEMIGRYSEEKNDLVKHGLGTSFKAHLTAVTQKSLIELSERCGSQGLFGYNQIIECQLGCRGISIAEGDVLVLCIRLASELLIGRYSMPPPRHPSCLLAQHEAGLFKEAQAHLKKAGGVHRSEHFNRTVLPLCQPLVEAIGQRMAYEAAVAADVHPTFLKLYEIGIIQNEPSWYLENGVMTRKRMFEVEDAAIRELFPNLSELLEQTGEKDYVHAPIVSPERWDAFVEDLKEDKVVGMIESKL